MLNKYEAVGIGVSIVIMMVALYVLRLDGSPLANVDATDNQAALVVVSQDGDQERALEQTLANSFDERGNLQSLVVDDVTPGTGAAVAAGDTVVVHYVGSLQNGQEFDNSHRRGQPYTFTVGRGQVIAGWDQGLVGMQVGGKRVLVIPPALAYGDRAQGGIPRNSTLVFAIELLEIK